ncbi:MAG: hypothetical protein LBL86_02650 [Coriobacteriales bacterium]|nr:hypothetical protein [Coriobacteriales bacterium]
MALPHPSLTLVLDIDRRLDSEELRLEVARSYSHVGPVLVRTHGASACDATTNTARLLVKLGSRRYLHSEDEGADELWELVVGRWLRRMLDKVGNNMRIYNRRQREIGGTELVFDWMDIDLQNGALHALLRLDSTSGIGPEAGNLLTALRNALNDGALEGDIREVTMPSAASWEAQKAACRAAEDGREAKRAAQAAAEDAAKREAREVLEAQADEEFLESPELTASTGPAHDDGGKHGDGGAEGLFELPRPDFPIDYRIWSVACTDGTMREFDSASCSFTTEGGLP